MITGLAALLVSVNFNKLTMVIAHMNVHLQMQFSCIEMMLVGNSRPIHIFAYTLFKFVQAVWSFFVANGLCHIHV